MSTNSSAAKDGGANQSKTTMPPVSQEYRENYDTIFRKKEHPVISKNHMDNGVIERKEKDGYRRLNVEEILVESDIYADYKFLDTRMIGKKVQAGDFYFRKFN